MSQPGNVEDNCFRAMARISDKVSLASIFQLKFEHQVLIGHGPLSHEYEHWVREVVQAHSAEYIIELSRNYQENIFFRYLSGKVLTESGNLASTLYVTVEGIFIALKAKQFNIKADSEWVTFKILDLCKPINSECSDEGKLLLAAVKPATGKSPSRCST